MIRHLYFILLLLGAGMAPLFGQIPTPSSISFTNPTPNPPNLAVDSYTRAVDSIVLKPGFKYGFVSGGATNLLNLNLNSNPPYVGSGYMGSGTQPTVNFCSTQPSTSNHPVAETNGNLMVSASGAAVYNIPVVVAPGTSGVQPKLSISYNSQGGTGLLGVGWNLNGLSAITRVAKTVQHDGNYNGINLTSSDAFALDGSRLFGLTGTYGQSNATYYTESETFASITSLSATTNGPGRFEVKDNSGNTLEYGLTSNSILNAVNTTTILSWYLERITDEFGNYMNYAYKHYDGEILIDHIDYTGNAAAGLGTYNSIQFDYVDLAERSSYFINTSEFRTTKLLKTITCYAGGVVSHKYTMKYLWNKGTYLADITEGDAAGNELAPTTFCWSDPTSFSGIKTAQNTPTFTPSDYIDLSTVAADLDGDGFSDYVCLNTGTPKRVHVLHNTYASNYGTANNNISYTNVYDQAVLNLNARILCNTVTDENYDNKKEVYTMISGDVGYISSTPAHSSTYWIMKTTASGTTALTSTIGSYSVTNFSTASPAFFYDVSDYTGDGVNDIVRMDPVTIYLSSGVNTYTYALPTPGNSFARPIDFDADAAKEFIVFQTLGTNTTTIRIVDFNGSGLPEILSFPYTNVDLNNFGYGDINADGNDDLVYVNSSNNMYVSYGNGATFLGPVQISAYVPLGSAAIRIQDVNGDGKGDITVTSSTQHDTYYSYGDLIIKGGSYTGSFKTDSLAKTYYTNYDEGDGTMYTHTYNDVKTLIQEGFTINTADLNGDGITDITSFDPSNNTTITGYIDGGVQQSIATISTPMKKTINISYANTSAGIYIQPDGTRESIYLNQSSTNYSAPLADYKPSLNCVAQTFETWGQSGQFGRRKQYIYSDAIYHRQGHGFLGFEQVLSFDMLTKDAALTKTNFDTQFYLPLVYEQSKGKVSLSFANNLYTYAFNTASLTAKSSSTYSIAPRNSHGHFTELLSTLNRDYLNSTQDYHDYSYDLNQGGHVVIQDDQLGWSSLGPVKLTTTTNSYTLNNGYYKLYTQDVNATQTGETSYDRSVKYNYDSQGHLTSTVNDYNIAALSNSMVTTAYSLFTPYGQPTKVVVSAPDISPSHTTTTTYDNFGRFMTSTTDGLGNTQQSSYEPLYGNVVSSTDIAGRVSTYSYDGLGRMTESVSPTMVHTRISYAWESPTGYSYDNGTPMGVYSQKTQTDGRPYTKVYYGSYGEALRNETQDYQGNLVINDTEYDLGIGFWPAGTVLEANESHYSGQATYIKHVYNYEYDYFRKVDVATVIMNGSSATYPGIGTGYTYNTPSTDASYNAGFIATSNQNSQTTTRYTNSGGQLLKVTNNYPSSGQQNIAYAYNSNGQPKSITLTNTGNTSQSVGQTFLYDGLGHTSQMYDPSLGTTNYTTNSIGQVLRKEDPNGIYTYAYDVLGRMQSKTSFTNGITTYSYATSGGGKGQILKITGPNSTADYLYDGFGRLTENKETLNSNGKILKTDYAYDLFGNEIQQTYPGGFIIKKTYNTYGVLTQISDNNNNMIWQLTSEDAKSRITQISEGNGLSTKNTYDVLGYLTGVNYGNSSVLTQTYTYNELTGNLTRREFHNYVDNTDLKETFGFDDMDRLKGSHMLDASGSTTVSSINQGFDLFGNITSKDDCGTYSYDPVNPYFLASINPAMNISLNTLIPAYNDINKISKLTEQGSNKENNFIYGVSDDRIRMDYSIGGSLQYTRYYADNYDREESSGSYKEWSYITAPGGICAVYYNNNGSASLNYVIEDHLGSPVLLMSSSLTPTIVEEYAFDSWGRRRSPVGWTYTNVPVSTKLIRGFTGHEMLDEFAVINMNARVYDPVSGRFIQSDDEIPDADNGQSYNRYSYCRNNPLKYTDPTGHDEVQDAFNDQLMYLRGAVDFLEMQGITYSSLSEGYSIQGDDLTRYNAQWQEINNAPAEMNYNLVPDNNYGTVDVGSNLLTSGGISEGISNYSHDALDVLGMVPGAGEFADGLNASMYAYEGDYVNAGISAAAMLPIGGWLATGGKWVNKATDIGTTVLGHYPDYVNVAKQLDANVFEVPTKYWEEMSDAEKWTANQKFLDRAINRGDNIMLATPANAVKPGSYYEMELNYLYGKGYSVSPDGAYLMKN